MNKNLDENQEVSGKEKSLANLQPIPFSAENQPSPESKKAGWNRRKRGQEMMNKVIEYFDMPYEELIKLKDRIDKKDPDTLKGLSTQDVIMLQYVFKIHNGKLLVDWLDRNISKAPQNIGLGDDDGEGMKGKITKIQVEIVDTNDTQTDEDSEK